MPLELIAEFDTLAGAAEIPHGWRGQIDFGERWSKSDEALWPASAGALREGEPLTYGCELRGTGAGGHRVSIIVFFLDEARAVMTPVTPFTLRDGRTARASGRLV